MESEIKAPAIVRKPPKVDPKPDIRAPKDVWTGITSSAERKKRQNRINQRAWRRRQKDAKVLRSQAPLTVPSSIVVPQFMHQVQPWMQQECIAAANSTPLPQEGTLLLTCPNRIAFIKYLLYKLYTDYTLNTLRPTNLQTLIRLNVLNSLARNATAMGFPPEGLCGDEAVSPYAQRGPHMTDSQLLSSTCPQGLRPTTLQRTMQHHPWFDLFPVPRFRDNMLTALAAGTFDEDELCADLLNVDDDRQADKPSLIVWGEPWDIRGWEATASFFRKWGWLAWGCPEIVEATNYWRGTRGEKRIVFEVS